MAKDRYYCNKMKTQAWKVTDTEIRYIRFQPPAKGLLFQNVTLQVDAFDPKEEEYLIRIAEKTDVQVYTGLYMLVLQEFKTRIGVFENMFQVKINPQ